MNNYQMTFEDFLNEEKHTKKEVIIPEENIDIMRPLIIARKQAGLTQKQLADRVKMDQGDISKLERGLRNPTVNLLMRLAKAMNLELDITYHQK